MNKTLATREAGLNLIELLLVLAVVVAIAVGAFIIYPRVQAGRSASAESQTLAGALAQVQSIFQNGQYRELDNDLAIKADVFPEKNIDGTNIFNEWGGPVTIFGANAAGTPATDSSARFVAIRTENVPSAVCQKLVATAQANWSMVQVGTTPIFDKVGATPIDYSEATAVDACTATDPVNLTFLSR